MKFRALRAEEIEVRISKVTSNGCGVLLYKNARCDMAILDETVGEMNWQRDHKEIKGNMYAGIGIYDADKAMWIWKWDCGKESYTEAEKGEASDSFKRAGFNWGIGRELYTAPSIWFKPDQLASFDGNNKKCYDSFKVESIEYDNGKITYLKVITTKTKAVFTWGNPNFDTVITKYECEELIKLVVQANVDDVKLLQMYNTDRFETLTKTQYIALKNKLEKAIINGK